MTKYNLEEKLEAVEEAKNGSTYKVVSEKYGVALGTVAYWVKMADTFRQKLNKEKDGLNKSLQYSNTSNVQQPIFNGINNQFQPQTMHQLGNLANYQYNQNTLYNPNNQFTGQTMFYAQNPRQSHQVLQQNHQVPQQNHWNPQNPQQNHQFPQQNHHNPQQNHHNPQQNFHNTNNVYFEDNTGSSVNFNNYTDVYDLEDISVEDTNKAVVRVTSNSSANVPADYLYENPQLSQLVSNPRKRTLCENNENETSTTSKRSRFPDTEFMASLKNSDNIPENDENVEFPGNKKHSLSEEDVQEWNETKDNGDEDNALLEEILEADPLTEEQISWLNSLTISEELKNTLLKVPKTSIDEFYTNEFDLIVELMDNRILIRNKHRKMRDEAYKAGEKTECEKYDSVLQSLNEVVTESHWERMKDRLWLLEDKLERKCGIDWVNSDKVTQLSYEGWMKKERDICVMVVVIQWRIFAIMEKQIDSDGQVVYILNEFAKYIQCFMTNIEMLEHLIENIFRYFYHFTF